jgi:hypothetical protein
MSTTTVFVTIPNIVTVHSEDESQVEDVTELYLSVLVERDDTKPRFQQRSEERRRAVMKVQEALARLIDEGSR